jgi:hypothetical protein
LPRRREVRRRVRGSRLTVGCGGLRRGNFGSKPLAYPVIVEVRRDK